MSDQDLSSVNVELTGLMETSENGDVFIKACRFVKRGHRYSKPRRDSFYIYLSPNRAEQYASRLRQAQDRATTLTESARKKMLQDYRTLFAVRFRAKGKWREKDGADYFLLAGITNPEVIKTVSDATTSPWAFPARKSAKRKPQDDDTFSVIEDY